jgi:hypothetical protein
MPWVKSVPDNTLLGRWEVTPGPLAHTIRDVLSLAIPDDLAEGGRSRPLLTRRRVVDYCHIAAALCPGMPCLPGRS